MKKKFYSCLAVASVLLGILFIHARFWQSEPSASIGTSVVYGDRGGRSLASEECASPRKCSIFEQNLQLITPQSFLEAFGRGVSATPRSLNETLLILL